MSFLKIIFNNTNTLLTYSLPKNIFRLMFFFILLNTFILLYLSTTYLINNVYLDQNDPLIASISWFFETNKDIYNDVDSPERYVGPWGPLIYLFNYISMKLLGPSIFSSKIFNYLSLILTQIIFFILTKKLTKNIKISLFFTGLISMIYLSTNAAPLSVRNDSLGYLLIIISLFFCFSNNKFKSNVNIISFGILASILINLKPQFILALLPSFIYCLEKNSNFIKVFLILIITFLLFFSLIWSFDNLSLFNYILWLQIILNDIGNFTFDIFIKNFSFLLFLIIPLSVLFFFNLKPTSLKEKIFFLLLIFISFAFSLYASRDGGGTADLFILIPHYIFLFCLILKKNNFFNTKELQGFLFIFIIFFLSFFMHSSTKGVVKTIKFIKTNDLSEEIEEVNKIIYTYPKGTRLSMGYGSSLKGYLNLYTRPILIYNNDYFFIELPHLFLTSISKPIEDKTLEKISNCINDVYLIPKDETPFKLENNKGYFSNNFIKTFSSSFKKEKSYLFFDTWECKN